MSYVNMQGRRLPFVVRYAADLITFRHLCWNLVASDLRSRFRRSKLGILWAIIQPLATSLIIAFVWGSVFKAASYWDFAIYVFSGMLLWEYFSSVTVVAQDSLMNAEGYLKQTRIPFFIFQVRTPLTAMVVVLCAMLGLLMIMAALQKLPPYGLHLALLPAFLGLFILFGIPLAAIMSLVGAYYRDVKHISQLVVQALFFVSPVMLGREILQRPELSFLKYANPMVPFIDMFRAIVIDGRMWNQTELYTVLAWIAALWIVAIAASIRVGRKVVFAL